jgi:3-hydroxyisobutyrate dehydrogenase-like beta-hydroxyacid dehydrogenase
MVRQQHGRMKQDVVVLGLGRMGRAMVETYETTGWRVASWSRSGGGTASTAAEAVAHDGPIVLALYDGPACRDVLHRITDHLAGRLVVVTSTVGAEEAEDLAQIVAGAAGRYVHAPVLGSVPAVRAGALRVLAGGAAADVDGAADVLAPLAAEVLRVGDAAGAAAAKLVANSSLAGAMLALRDSLAGAAALGLPLDAALDVLSIGRLGDAVAVLRPRLEAPGGPAHFTVGALLKDVTLLADAGGPADPAERIRSLIAAGDLRAEDDVANLALPVALQAAAR